MSRRKHSKQRSKAKRTNKAKNRSKHTPPKRNKEELTRMLDWFLPQDSIFSKLKFHGNTKWAPQYLVFLALLGAWSESRCLTDAFTDALGHYRSMFRSFVLRTYQGFMGALTRWTPTLMNILWPLLHERMQEIGGRFWRIHGWVLIAFDGSRSSAPRTRPMSRLSVQRTTGKEKPPSTARRSRKACGESRMRKPNRNPKSHKLG